MSAAFDRETGPDKQNANRDKEEQFLGIPKEVVDSLGKFQVNPYYCDKTDSLICYFKNVRGYDDWINEDVSLIRSLDTEEIVGVEIRDIRNKIPGT